MQVCVRICRARRNATRRKKAFQVTTYYWKKKWPYSYLRIIIIIIIVVIEMKAESFEFLIGLIFSGNVITYMKIIFPTKLLRWFHYNYRERVKLLSNCTKVTSSRTRTTLFFPLFISFVFRVHYHQG